MPELFDGSHPNTNQPKRRPSPDEYSEVLRNERPATSGFKSFMPKPFAMHFDTQSTEEHILLLLRRHPITQLPWIITAVIFAFLPLFLTTLPIISSLPGNYVFAAVVGWYLLLTGFILESFLSWFFNVYIITDERIIDVDFLSLIYKNVSSAKIDNIEDVTARSGGALQSIFHFGTVFIQTAGQKREFEFEDVPQPEKVTRLLNELILEEEREKIEGRVM
jgi:uncharacterized membrane protein YdbT with pleckstrin-like domain